VPGNDAFDDRESDAGTFEFAGAMQALEYAEQLVGILHIEAGAVIPDVEDRFIAIQRPAYRTTAGGLRTSTTCVPHTCASREQVS